jgi:hypothetical protein
MTTRRLAVASPARTPAASQREARHRRQTVPGSAFWKATANVGEVRSGIFGPCRPLRRRRRRGMNTHWGTSVARRGGWLSTATSGRQLTLTICISIKFCQLSDVSGRPWMRDWLRVGASVFLKRPIVPGLSWSRLMQIPPKIHRGALPGRTLRRESPTARDPLRTLSVSKYENPRNSRSDSADAGTWMLAMQTHPPASQDRMDNANAPSSTSSASSLSNMARIALMHLSFGDLQNHRGVACAHSQSRPGNSRPRGR